MSIQPISIATALAPPGAAVPATTGKSELDGDDFLKLLVAQLRYQDPLNPADGTEFVAQTAQLHSVEKLEALTKTSEDSFALQQKWSAAALVGRDVSYPGTDGESLTGRVVSVLFGSDGPVLRVNSGDPASPTTDVALDLVGSVSDTAR